MVPNGTPVTKDTSVERLTLLRRVLLGVLDGSAPSCINKGFGFAAGATIDLPDARIVSVILARSTYPILVVYS